jgi:hypothetical protein
MRIIRTPAVGTTTDKRTSPPRPLKVLVGAPRSTKLFGQQSPRRRSGPAVQHLLDEMPLQRAFDQLRECGPRAVAMFCAELLDSVGADPAALDMVLSWRHGFTPEVIAAMGREWPRCLDAVP